jgi:hypothetical protein
MKNINIRQSPNDNRQYLNNPNVSPQINEILEISDFVIKKGNIPSKIYLTKTRTNVIIKCISYEVRLTPNEFSMKANQLFKSIDELYLFIKNIFEKKNAIAQDVNNRMIKLILATYDMVKGGVKQIELYLYTQNNINDFILNDLYFKYLKLEENFNALNEKNKLLIDENLKMKDDNLKFKSDILKLKSDMNLLQIQNSRYENHINLLLSGIDKITTFIDESSIKADEYNNQNSNSAIKKSASLIKSNSVSQNLNFHNNLNNMYQSIDNYSLKQNQSLSQFNSNAKNVNQDTDQDKENNQEQQNMNSLNEEQLYRTEEDRVIFRNGILYGIIKKYSEIEKVVAKIQSILLKGAKFTIVYKATELGDKAAIFHQKCDNLGISLVLIETVKGVRFGGFTTKSWKGNCEQKIDDDAFVFSVDKNKIYEVINNEMAIGCYPKFGPVFFGCQIRVYDNFFSKNCTTCRKKLNFKTTEDYELNNGEQFFVVKDIEVYSIEGIDV